MVLRKWQDFIDNIAERRIRKEGGTGTIWLKNVDEFHKVVDYYEGHMVSPGGAAGMLKVSRAMIHQLEREGRIRAYRVIITKEDWGDAIPLYLRLIASRKDQYIYIPVDDLVKYAEAVGRKNISSSLQDEIERRKKKQD
jgi:hypothetical protein